MLAIPATLVLLVGIYDDLRGTNAVVKFAALGLIATLFYAMGGRIDALSIPLFGPVQLPALLSFVITVVWLVGITNAFNLIDGMDGLASGAALFSSLVILGVSVSQERTLMIVVSLVLCGAVAGFLRYNFNPASIFLGDSGALFIGFILAALSVLGTQKATTAVAIVVPILAFGFPVVDTAMTMARRAVSRKPDFHGRQRTHSSHATRARLVATARGAGAVWRMRTLWPRRTHLSRQRIETDRVHVVRDFGGGNHRGGPPSLSRSRRDSRRREANGRRSPATSREQHSRPPRRACAFESFRPARNV